MPHVPLKVLRGQQDEEDVQDQYYERFQAPPGTSTEEEEERAAAAAAAAVNDSRSSHSSHEDITTDVDDVSDEGMERYLDRHTSAMHSVNQVDDDFGEIQNNPNESTQEFPEYDTTGSVDHQASHVQVVADVHRVRNRNETESDSLSNDDMAPLLHNEH